MNITSAGNFSVESYAPPDQCIEWCATQHVIHSNNLELNGIIILAVAYFLISLYFWMEEIPKIKHLQYMTIYIVRIIMLLFLVWYMTDIYWGIY